MRRRPRGEKRPVEPFSEQWYRNRAVDSIAPMGDGQWDFSDSLLLYAASGAEDYERIQDHESPYARLVTLPERRYLESIADEVVEMLPADFDYIDLGPGTEHKEQFLFDALRRQGKSFRYMPVDVSRAYLAGAKKYAEDQGIPAKPIQAAFEDLPRVLGAAEKPRFVSLGLTFINYDPRVAFDFLRGAAGEGGSIFIDVQDRNQVDMEELMRIYREDARAIVGSKLPFVGLDIDKDIERVWANDGVEVWCQLNGVSPVLKQKGIKSGDSMVVLRSKRYAADEFTETLQASGMNHTPVGSADSFTGAILYSSL